MRLVIGGAIDRGGKLRGGCCPRYRVASSWRRVGARHVEVVALPSALDIVATRSFAGRWRRCHASENSAASTSRPVQTTISPGLAATPPPAPRMTMLSPSAVRRPSPSLTRTSFDPRIHTPGSYSSGALDADRPGHRLVLDGHEAAVRKDRGEIGCEADEDDPDSEARPMRPECETAPGSTWQEAGCEPPALTANSGSLRPVRQRGRPRRMH